MAVRTIAETWLRLRVDEAQVKRDVRKAVSGVDTGSAGGKAGKDFGEEFVKESGKQVKKGAAKSGDDFGKEFRKHGGGAVAAITGIGDAMTAASGEASIFARALAGVGLSTGLLEPAIASATVVVGALSASFVSAGAGAGAYAIALKPVLTQVGNLMKLQQQAATGSKTAQKQLQEMLKTTPPAVVRFAAAVKDAQTAYTRWGASLAVPVLAPLSRALTFVRPVLSAIRPLVTAAAAAFDELVGELGQQIKGGGLTRFVSAVLPHVQIAIIAIGHSIGNIVSGIWGVIRAFLPASDVVIARVDGITAAFKRWGQSLPSHSGFQALMKMYQQQGPLLGKILGNVVVIVKNLTAALAGMTTPANSRALLELLLPLTSIMAKLSANQALVQTISMFLLLRKVLAPIGPLLKGVSAGITAVSEGVGVLGKAWKLLSVIFATSGIGTVIVLLALLAAGFYLLWTRSTGFRVALEATWHAILVGAKAVVSWFSGSFVNFFTITLPHVFQNVLNWIKGNWPYIVGFLAGPVGIAVAIIAKHWTTFTNMLVSGWQWIYRNVWVPVRNFFTVTLPGWFRTAIGFLITQYVTPWKNLIYGAWVWIYNNVWKPVYGFFTKTLPGWFSGAVAAISAAWSGISKAFGTPVYFVAHSILKPLAQGADWLLGKVGIHLDTKSLDAFIAAIPHFQEGGQIPGFGGGDVVPALLEPGEAVVDKYRTRKYAGVLGAMGVPGFQFGGIIGRALSSLPGIHEALQGLGLLSHVSGADAHMKAITDLLGKTVPGGGAFAAGLQHFIPYLVQNVLKFVGNKLKGMVTIQGAPPGIGGNVTSWLLAAMAATGAPANWLGALQLLVSKESGGNPLAVNPITVMGEHATGLMQMLPSTYAQFATLAGGIFNAISNAAAAIRYIMARYGSPFNIPGLFGGTYVGYRRGGRVRSYHSGGRIPEPVIGLGASGTAYQFAAGEWVHPHSGVVMNLGGVVIREEADLNLLAAKLGFAIDAAGHR